MKQAGLPVGETVVYNRKTDPNKLLGRPGGYIEKASWADERLECFTDEPDWDCGGDIEIFDDPHDLKERWQYLGGLANTPPIGGFYMWMTEFSLLRVGHDLTRDRAREYEDFFERFFEGEEVTRYRGP
jgi:hypothetical protein